MYKKVYKGISIGNTVLHMLAFATVVVSFFLPYVDDQNYWQTDTVMPFVCLALLAVAALFALLAVRRPLLATVSPLLVTGILLCLGFPAAVEAMVYGLMDPWIGHPEMTRYGVGYYLASDVFSYLWIEELVFAVYACVSRAVFCVIDDLKNKSV